MSYFYCTKKSANNALLAKVITAAMVCLVSACSENRDEGSSNRSGVFLDSAVSGLTYTTASSSGTTDQSGEFDYITGESITFSLGQLTLPEIPAAPIITPLSVFETDDINDLRVINLSRLLQSLDLDGDPSNGIVISESAASSAPAEVNFSLITFDDDVANLVANSGSVNTALIDADDAYNHLQETLDANGLGASNCANDHPLVGRSAEFVNIFHGIAGRMEVIDNCTIDITGFAYDGGGPQVYFYAANDQAYGSADAFSLGPLLSGTVFQDDRFRLVLPADRTLDDLNGISVWCADVQVNFGDAYLGG